MSTDRLEKLMRQRDWRAALIILFGRFSKTDGRIWNHVDLDRESIHFKEILSDRTFSSGEMALLQIAASLFSPEFEVALWDVLTSLDETATDLAIAAIGSFTGLPNTTAKRIRSICGSLKNVVESMSAIGAHDCKGWDCSTCRPSVHVSQIQELITQYDIPIIHKD